MGFIWLLMPRMPTFAPYNMSFILHIMVSNVSILFTDASGKSAHSHQTCQACKAKHACTKTPSPNVDKVADESLSPSPPASKRAQDYALPATSSLGNEDHSDPLVEILEQDRGLQDAFGSLLNAHEVLGAQHDHLYFLRG